MKTLKPLSRIFSLKKANPNNYNSTKLPTVFPAHGPPVKQIL